MNTTNMAKITACVVAGVIVAGMVMNWGRSEYDILNQAHSGYDS